MHGCNGLVISFERIIFIRGATKIVSRWAALQPTSCSAIRARDHCWQEGRPSNGHEVADDCAQKFLEVDIAAVVFVSAPEEHFHPVFANGRLVNAHKFADLPSQKSAPRCLV